MIELQHLSIIFLITSFIFVWSPSKIKVIPLWIFPFLLSIFVGVVSGALAPLSVVWISLACVSFYSVRKWARYSTWILILSGFYALVMGMNLLPGFNKIQLISPRLLGDSVNLFSLEYRLAKPIVGLLILASIAQKCESFKEILNSLVLVKKWVLPTLAVLAVGMLLGVAIDVKFFVWTPIFIVCNLFLSVIPEEAFFRGFLQQPLQNRFGKAVWIIPLMGLFFALVHIPPAYINPIKFYIVMGLAGACYAWAYSIKDRIELAIASHILLNVLHFIFLAYPLAF